jgi:hypothetical protein
MAGNLTVEECGNVFQTKAASSNYGVDNKGHVGLYVNESDRSWASSSASNDNRAVTIEVANDGGESTGWHVSDTAMTTLIKLVADICKRNNIKKLKWCADKSLIGVIGKQNMTVHRWFANKSCPGDYLYSKMGYIADEVNKCLTTSQSSQSSQSSTTFKVKLKVDLNIRDGANGKVVQTNGAKKGTVYTIVKTSGDWGKLKSGAGWISISNKYVNRV